MLDLATLSTAAPSEEGRWLEIRHPITGAPMVHEDGRPLRIRVRGVDSSTFAKIREGKLRRLFVEGLPAEEDPHKRDAATLADLLVGWEGLVWRGVDLPFTRAAAVEVLTETPWLREQIERFAGERANFLPASSAV